VQEPWLAGVAADALAAECTALAGRGRVRGADRARRVAARIRRRHRRRALCAAELAVVDGTEVRAFTAGDVERAVGAEVEVADRVARELLAPALDLHLLVRGDVAGQRQPGQAPLHHAAVGRRPG